MTKSLRKNRPQISIITINYNNCEGLLKTIRSVVSQTYCNFEYIIIDGGSTDGSVDVIKQYANRIDYWVSEPDRGIYHAMNKGTDKAIGEYCLYLNSGDCLHDENVLATVCKEGVLDKDVIIGAIQWLPSGYVKRLKVKESFVLLDFWYGDPIPHQSTFIRRSICSSIRYDESLKVASDWKFFLQVLALQNCSCKSVECIVADFAEGGISSITDSSDEHNKFFSELLPKEIYADYQRLTQREYDAFFIRLRLCKYAKVIYTISVFLVRLISLFRPSAQFSRNFPLFLYDK